MFVYICPRVFSAVFTVYNHVHVFWDIGQTTRQAKAISPPTCKEAASVNSLGVSSILNGLSKLRVHSDGKTVIRLVLCPSISTISLDCPLIQNVMLRGL